MYIKTLSVSALNNYIKKIIDSDFILNNILVKGEISNFKRHSSGHMYFSLKDETSKVNCVMFSSNGHRLQFVPKDGMKVEIRGRVSLYVKEGSYQLYCEEMKQQGIGDLYAAFLELKSTLEKEGLFSESHKKSLPSYPKKVGVITSPTGAAVRDIINVSRRRNKSIDILIYPSLVQGEEASKNIIEGIRYLDSIEEVEVIIIARGGGSIEELWAFNNEELARAIYDAKTPIVTGVGHETDFTIVDFVSDRRASTPSAAAEIVVPSYDQVKKTIENHEDKINDIIINILKHKRKEIDIIKRNLEFNSPLNYMVNQYKYIEDLKNRLSLSIKLKLSKELDRIKAKSLLLNAHNPLNILNKGYSIVLDEEEKLINTVDEVKSKEEFTLVLRDGKIRAKYIKKI